MSIDLLEKHNHSLILPNYFIYYIGRHYYCFVERARILSKVDMNLNSDICCKCKQNTLQYLPLLFTLEKQYNPQKFFFYFSENEMRCIKSLSTIP